MRVRQPLLALLLLASLLGGCAGLDVQRHPSQALPASDSAFGRSIQVQQASTAHQLRILNGGESPTLYDARGSTAMLVKRSLSQV